MIQNKKAFTMIELVFVIVIIGILAAVAIPRLAATRDDAEISKARTTLSAVRNSLAMERQKRILRGEFDKITAVGNATNVFGNFFVGATDTGVSVLEYAMPTSSKKYGWKYITATDTYFCLTKTCSDDDNNRIKFQVSNGKFLCKSGPCSMLGATIE